MDLDSIDPELKGYSLAVKCMAGIEAHPEHWKQQDWDCGTAGCLAGWAHRVGLGTQNQALPYQQNQALPYQQNQALPYQIVKVARLLLFGKEFDSLTQMHSNWVTVPRRQIDFDIFSAGNSLNDLYKLLALKYDIDEEVFRKDVANVEVPPNPWSDS